MHNAESKSVSRQSKAFQSQQNPSPEEEGFKYSVFDQRTVQGDKCGLSDCRTASMRIKSAA